MGVRTTSGQDKTALFDSVTGIAFGPVFDTADEADDFLDWLEEDPRTLLPTRLENLHAQWGRERLDPVTGELLA